MIPEEEERSVVGDVQELSMSETKFHRLTNKVLFMLLKFRTRLVSISQVRDFATRALQELDGLQYDVDGIRKLEELTAQMNLEEGSTFQFSAMLPKSRERSHRHQPKGMPLLSKMNFISTLIDYFYS